MIPGNIYIISPGNMLSGGVSSLHNLCKSLNNNKYNAMMYYIDIDEDFINSVLCPKFNNPRVNEISDIVNNFLIVPETLTDILKNYKNITKIIYWLSIKYFFKKSQSYPFPLNIYFIQRLFYPEDFYNFSLYFTEKIKQLIIHWGVKKSVAWHKDILHITNSHYLYLFCRYMGASQLYLLYNPLIDEVFKVIPTYPKKLQILVGSRMSKLFEYYLKYSLPEMKIIRLKRLSVEKVYQLMSESLIYADFSVSNRDRSPREAALLGCIVFTSNKGSAQYQEDVPIPEYYKIDGKMINLIKIKKRMKHVINNYNEVKSDFDSLKAQIMKEKKGFNDQVNGMFCKILSKHK